MGSFSIWHWLIVLAVVLLLFGGGGKIPKLMKDMGTGINSFKKGLKDDDKKKADGEGDDPKALEGDKVESSAAESSAEPQEDKKKAANG